MLKNVAQVAHQQQISAQCYSSLPDPPATGAAEWQQLLAFLENLTSDWGLVGLAVWLIFTGRLVPKRLHDQALKLRKSKRRPKGKGKKGRE